eukprot:GILI01011317.1.p1 GENE.GILI01011317.1~~GILI01011317.1.p1  ORF type:complete len:667 (-),score=237.22 GILI01011317.1:198-2198(-)
MATRVVTETRRFDHVYDPVYADPWTSIRGYAAEAAPSAESGIMGVYRYKYFKRPLVPTLNPAGPQIVYAKAPVDSAPQQNYFPAEVEEPKTRTVGVQTIYRDSEAQTDPYTPDYLVAPGSMPEVLTLTHLKYGQGLPASLAEVEMIERMRQKRAFEAALPPVTDEASFQLRRKLMEEQEFREWATREEEIKKLHAIRLDLIREALKARDERNTERIAAHLEELKQRKIEEKDRALAVIQRKRIKILRKMFKARKMVEKQKDQRDMVQEYAYFGSKVYAPVAREGAGQDRNSNKYVVQPADFNSYDGLLALEDFAPKSLFDTSVKLIKPEHRKPVSRVKARKESLLGEHLAYAESLIKSTKKPASEKDDDPHSKKFNLRNIQERPPTPTVAHISPEEEDRQAAVLLLQRLIRGRAVQNIMFEGKEKRLDLINELRSEEEWDKSAVEDEEKQLLQAYRDRMADAVVENIQGDIIARTLDSLSKELLRFREEQRISAMVKLAERDRRMREAIESGRRQAEEQLRAREDELFRQIMSVNQGTVDSYLQSIIAGAVDRAAQKQSLEEAKLKATQISSIVNDLEEKYNSPEVVVKELLGSFLLPEVQRAKVKKQLEVEERRFVNAAHKAVLKAMDLAEKRLALEPPPKVIADLHKSHLNSVGDEDDIETAAD